MRHGPGTLPSSAALRVVALSLALMGALLCGASAAQGVTLPPGFQQSAAFTGLTEPMSIEFAPNGRVFVAEKSGIIKTYSSPTDTTATVVSDLRTKVHNYWDRGLMTIAVDPNFPTNPYIYVYYVHDAAIGGTAPRWGTANTTSDPCPTPPGPTDDGCVVSGRISRIQVAGEVQTGPEQVLIEDWCQQYPSHAGGGLEFGTDGMLYYSGGEGASWTFADYGQAGSPNVNPCGDPPGGVGGSMKPADRRGWTAALPGRPLQRRRARVERRTDPHRPRHGRGRPGEPPLLQLQRAGAASSSGRDAQPLPPGDPPRHRRRLGRRRGSWHVGGDQSREHAVRWQREPGAGPATRAAWTERQPTSSASARWTAST